MYYIYRLCPPCEFKLATGLNDTHVISYILGSPNITSSRHCMKANKVCTKSHLLHHNCRMNNINGNLPRLSNKLVDKAKEQTS